MEMEKEEIISLIDTRLEALRFELRELAADMRRSQADVADIREIVIGRGGPETLMALVNTLVISEKARHAEENELKKMRRNLLVSVTIILVSAIGGVLWAIIKILP